MPRVLELIRRDFRIQRLQLPVTMQCKGTDARERNWTLTSLLVVPGLGYQAPREDSGGGALVPRPKCDELYRGDIVVSIRENQTADAHAHYWRMSAMLLADTYWHLTHVSEQSGMAHAGRLIEWMSKRVEEKAGDVDALTSALALARDAWHRYRHALFAQVPPLHVIVPAPCTLVIERREATLGGEGDIIREPLEVDLVYVESVRAQYDPKEALARGG